MSLLQLNLKDLHKLLLEQKHKLFNLRCQHAISELTDTSRFKYVKRQIAKIKTEISKKTKV